MITPITEPSDLALIALPTWMPGSRRTAGYRRSLWYALWSSVALAFLPALNGIVDFGSNDPTLWTGPDEAEGDFLSYWTPELAALRQSGSGPETDGQRIERLLTLRALVQAGCDSRTASWAAAAALGLAVRNTVPSGGLPDGCFVPSLHAGVTVSVSLGNTDPNTLIRRQSLGDSSLLIASTPLWARRPSGSGPPARYSPWGRASAAPVLDADLFPLPGGEISTAVKDTRGRQTIAYSFPSRAYMGQMRPGLKDPAETVEVLTCHRPVRAVTPTEGFLRGDADLRVPGASLPSVRWRGVSAPQFSPTWSAAARADASSIAPPFDLDAPLSQPAPSAGDTYGSGTVPSGLPGDHPLSPDYA